MADREHSRAEQQGDGQPENIRELEDASGGGAMGDQGRGRYSDAELPESGMGGTSDAGTAADDAAEAAALGRGLPDDRTQGISQTPGAGTRRDQGMRGSPGGTSPLEEPTTTNLDRPDEEG